MQRVRVDRMKNSRQHGAAILIMMLVLVMVSMSAMFKYMDGSSVKIERDKKTAAVLAEAKMALIGYFLIKNRLPCPEDSTKVGGLLEGSALASCSEEIDLEGGLPWKTLKIEPLVDGNLDKLFYVISKDANKVPIDLSGSKAGILSYVASTHFKGNALTITKSDLIKARNKVAE